MNQTAIKELQKLMALCMEINEKTEHRLACELNATTSPTFSVYVFENNNLENMETIVMVDKITLPNINKCRQKLFKYKEQ